MNLSAEIGSVQNYIHEQVTNKSDLFSNADYGEPLSGYHVWYLESNPPVPKSKLKTSGIKVA